MATFGMVNGKYQRLGQHEYLDGDPDDFLDTADVATLLGASRGAVHNWRTKQQDRCPPPEPDGRLQRRRDNGQFASWSWVWRKDRAGEWLVWYERYKVTRKQHHCPCCRYRQAPEFVPSDVAAADG